MAKTKKNLSQILEDMHVNLAQTLLDRVKNGSATAADLNVARQFLKDNGIEGNLENHKPLAALTDALPFEAEGTNG